MKENLFNDFILVGGTALSLQLGHRRSVDIDMFTPLPYGSVDWNKILNFFFQNFTYVAHNSIFPLSFGLSVFVGQSEEDCVKVDLYYTETFVFPILCIDNVRIASIPEIIAMKLDVISRTGRKKDFWDIHALIDRYTPKEMIDIFHQRYPYNDELDISSDALLNFEKADGEWNPICLLGKHWEIIKLDLFEYFSTPKSGFNIQ
jgi:predicted nucleotidyltransferase component of viral defense system